MCCGSARNQLVINNTETSTLNFNISPWYKKSNLNVTFIHVIQFTMKTINIHL